MQNPTQKFKQSFAALEEPGTLSENVKTLTPTTLQFNIFC